MRAYQHALFMAEQTAKVVGYGYLGVCLVLLAAHEATCIWVYIANRMEK